MINIGHFQRRPFEGCFSIEGLFSALRPEMQRLGVNPIKIEAPFFSKGIVRRCYNIAWSNAKQLDVNHITGDIHYIAYSLRPRKSILTIHDLVILDRLKGIKRHLVRELWFSRPIARCRFITVISNATAQALVRHVPKTPVDKVVVIPDTVLPVFKPSPKEFNPIRPRILQIGVGKNKNVPNLIRALTGLDVEIVIIGKPDESLNKLLTASGLVHTVKSNLSDAELYNEYEAADIVSFVSTSEGFGMPILEGQWVERAVVTSSVSSMPEVAGKGACYVNPNETSSIREGFLRVIRDQAFRDAIVREGILNRTRFSCAAVAALYVDLYYKVYDESRVSNK